MVNPMEERVKKLEDGLAKLAETGEANVDELDLLKTKAEKHTEEISEVKQQLSERGADIESLKKASISNMLVLYKFPGESELRLRLRLSLRLRLRLSLSLRLSLRFW